MQRTERSTGRRSGFETLQSSNRRNAARVSKGFIDVSRSRLEWLVGSSDRDVILTDPAPIMRSSHRWGPGIELGKPAGAFAAGHKLPVRFSIATRQVG